MGERSKGHTEGIQAALASAIFLGLAPIFGKQAILHGADPRAVAASRTLLAALLLLVVIMLLRPKYLYIYPAGLLGCFLAGSINGLGSLFYYSALVRINAGLGHLLYSFYPLFVALWLWFGRQPLSRLTILRLLLTLPALFLLTLPGPEPIDLVGVAEMLIASLLYALHLPLNQRVLYDMPAPTVTLYTLLSMSLVVGGAFLISFPTIVVWRDVLPASTWQAVIGLAGVTFLSRLTLFQGVKRLGGMQTALLGLSELLVAVMIASLWLGERLSFQQWCGAALLIFSLALVGRERLPGDPPAVQANERKEVFGGLPAEHPSE